MIEKKSGKRVWEKITGGERKIYKYRGWELVKENRREELERADGEE
jgi:hypothetical protein